MFTLNKNFGVLNLNDPENQLLDLRSNDKSFLFKNGILFGKSLAFYKSLVEKKNKKIRWAIGSIYLKGKVFRQIPEKKILKDIKNISEFLFNLIGYIKIKDFAIEIIFFEKIIKAIIKRNKKVFYFDYYFLNKFKISEAILFSILTYLGFTKIAGTQKVSYWIKKKINHSKSSYNKDSPFYVLKKLQ